MSVQSLGCPTRTEQHPQGILPTPEAFDDLLRRGVGELAVHEADLLIALAPIALELTIRPAQGLRALGEDDQAVGGMAHVPARLSRRQVGQQLLIPAERFGLDTVQRRLESLSILAFLRFLSRGLTG